MSATSGDKDYGLMAGWMNMAGNIGQIIGPIAAAAVFDITGTYVMAWYVFAGLFVLVSILYYLSGVLNKKELKAAGYDPDPLRKKQTTPLFPFNQYKF
ncbi:MAG: MFS transporter [Oscillospiraceae bacterium]